MTYYLFDFLFFFLWNLISCRRTHVWTELNSGTAQMCNTVQKRGGGGVWCMISHMSQKMLRKKKILSLISVKAMCFTTSKTIWGSFLMVTHSSPLQHCCFLPINRVCGTEEASCHLRHTWINLVCRENQLLPLAHGVTHASMEQRGSAGHPGSSWLLTLFIHADWRSKHLDAALCWHPGQNGIIKLNWLKGMQWISQHSVRSGLLTN